MPQVLQVPGDEVAHGDEVLGVGRAREKAGKLAYGADIAGLRLGLKLAHAHVVEHALTQRRDGR